MPAWLGLVAWLLRALALWRPWSSVAWQQVLLSVLSFAVSLAKRELCARRRRAYKARWLRAKSASSCRSSSAVRLQRRNVRNSLRRMKRS